MPRFSSPFTALKFRDFRLLWIGSLISNIGSQMQIVAISWHVYTLTHSAFSLGFIGAARLIPLLLVSPFSGLTADRYDRRIVALITQIIQFITTLLLALLTLSSQVNIFTIYVIIVINSLAISLDSPARQSLIPSLVPAETLRNALGLNTTMYQSAIVIGPSIAGFIIALSGIGSVYLINSLSFIAVIIALLLMRPLIKKPQAEEITFSLQSLQEGFRFVFSHPLISSSMLLDFFAMFFSSATILMPIYANDILKVGPEGLGFLYAAPAVGSVVLGFVYSSLHQVKNQGKILLVSVAVCGLATVCFGISRSFYLSLFFLAINGMGDAVSTITRNTIRQFLTPDQMRGRMGAISMIFYFGGPQLGEIEAGVAAGIWGGPFSVITGGIGAVISTVVLALVYPQLRKYQGHEIKLI